MKTRTLLSILILVLVVLIISGCVTTPKTERQKRDISDSRFLQAIYNGNPARIKKLIEAGANVNAKDTYGRTALMVALSRRRTDIAWLLIEASPDVNTQDKNGNTALMLALYNGYFPIAKWLIWTGAVIHLQELIDITQSNYRDTALLIALESVQMYDYPEGEGLVVGIQTVEFPIKAGVKFITWRPNLKALIFVTSAGHEEVVKLLIDNGALITTDEWGRMALILGITKRNAEIIELLKEAGAKE